MTTPGAWWHARRPEIVEDFEREIYGRVPAHVPDVTWSVAKQVDGVVGTTPVLGRQLIGHVDNTAMPSIAVDIDLVLVTPAKAKGPVPVMIMFRKGSLPQVPGGPAPPRDPWMPPPAPGDDPPATEQLIAAGWGYAFLNPMSVQADNGAGLTRGIIGLVNRGQPRKPDDWGALRAWAWGAARALDFLETDPAVDATRVGIEGVSRFGKAALVTMAFEPRFAVVLVGSSGKGGATLFRRNFGEAVESLTGSGEYHWMAGNFLKYGAAASRDRQQERRRPAGRRARADRVVRAASDVHQLRHSREGRCEVAGSAGELHGHDRGRDRCSACSGRGACRRPKTTARRRCRPTTRACSKGNWPGGSTMAATPTVRTGSTSSPGRSRSSPRRRPSRHRALISSGPRIAPVARSDRNSRLAHEQLLAKAKRGRIDVYFVGDSITRRWGATDYPELLAHWTGQLLRLECRELRLGRRRHPEHPLAARARRARGPESAGGRGARGHEQRGDARGRRGEGRKCDAWSPRRCRDLPSQGAQPRP